MDAKLEFRRFSGASSEEARLISFSFSKDVYTPYTSLTARISADGTDFSDICEILLYVNGRLVHFGMCDTIEKTVSESGTILTLASSGFTSQLCRNQLEPGLKSGISVDSLFEDYYTFPNVTHEKNNDESSYIFVKNGAVVWDGIVNLSYKLYGTYPFILGTNCVRLTSPEAPAEFSFDDSQIIERGSGSSCRKIVSDFHMADINGDYGSFDLSVDFAADRKVVRHTYLELDRQFLYDPVQALEYRAKYTRRASEWHFCRYSGYSGEDLSDLVSFGSISGMKICAVRITGDSRGIVTELSVYNDGFFNT